MGNNDIDQRLQHARTILHLHLAILQQHGSLKQERQCDPIVLVIWRVAARPERRDSHGRPLHSTSVGLAHRKMYKIHPGVT